MDCTKRSLEELYLRYNHRRFVHPDPIETIYGYEDVGDREIAALLVSSLAYGRVEQILESARFVLNVLGSPLDFARNAERKEIVRSFRRFKHRFTTGSEVSALILGIRSAIESRGSLGACFASGLGSDDSTVRFALARFIGEIAPNRLKCKTLIPDPDKGSALKRLNLFLRWMVRRDDIDPGGWDQVPASKLIVPLDTHMHKISLELGLTERRQADMRTALEITSGLARLSPEDPVKYDFALTRIGILGGRGRSSS